MAKLISGKIVSVKVRNEVKNRRTTRKSWYRAGAGSYFGGQ